jgi:hypothetical protein
MVTHKHAVEVDARLADLWNAEQDEHRNVQYAISSLRWTVRTQDEARRGHEAKAEDVEARAREALETAMLNGRDLTPWTRTDIEKGLQRLDAIRVEIVRIRGAAAPLEAEFASERWSRFFLVQNVNGHIHSSMHCSTCRWDTQYAWLPTLSGLTETDAVEEQGPRLCSVCYPTAPVEWTLGLPKVVDPTVCTGSGLPAVIVERQGTRWNRTTWKDEPYTYGAKTCQTCGRSDLTFKGEMLTASKHKVPKVKKAKAA